MKIFVIKFVGIVILSFVFNSINISKISAQIGIEVVGMQSKLNDWDELIDEYALEDYDFFRYTVGGGINYWFRLKEYRVEFTPGIFYHYSQFKFSNPACSYRYHYMDAGAELDINLYPFDFMRRTYEKDCPSFSNKEQWFSKSFFFQFSPGLYISRMDISNKDIISYDMAGKFDFGVGIDMKLSHHIIVAPIIKYGFNIGQEWEGLGEFHGLNDFNDKTSGNYLSLTLSFFLK